MSGIMLLIGAIGKGGLSFTFLVGSVAGKNFASRQRRRIKRPASQKFVDFFFFCLSVKNRTDDRMSYIIFRGKSLPTNNVYI